MQVKAMCDVDIHSYIPCNTIVVLSAANYTYE